MKIFTKRIFVIACTLSLTAVTFPKAVAAEDLQQKLDQYKAQSSQLDSQIASEAAKEKQAEAQVFAMKQSIQVLNDSITRYQTSITEQEKEIQALNLKQKELEAEKVQHEEQLGGLLRSYYENGISSYLEVLFKSKSITELVTRIDELHYIVTYYDQLHEEIASLNQSLVQQKSDIEKKNNELAAALQEKQSSQQALQVAMQKEQSSLSQLSTQKKQDLAASSQLQGRINSVEQLIAQENLERQLDEAGKAAGINPGANDPGTGITTPVKIDQSTQALIAFAEQFLGTPYVWGGTTPSPGFDCSGFVQYVYKHFGINLNRTSEMQYNEGTPVAYSNLKPGDLLFFHTYTSGASHVGIYIGNGVMIDSSSYGVAYDDITYSYWSSRYLGARRVIQ